MTTEEAPLTSKAELEEELNRLLRRAHESGIDVRGGFECLNAVEHPDWDVVVTEMLKDESSE